MVLPSKRRRWSQALGLVYDSVVAAAATPREPNFCKDRRAAAMMLFLLRRLWVIKFPQRLSTDVLVASEYFWALVAMEVAQKSCHATDVKACGRLASRGKTLAVRFSGPKTA